MGWLSAEKVVATTTDDLRARRDLHAGHVRGAREIQAGLAVPDRAIAADIRGTREIVAEYDTALRARGAGR